MNRVTAGLAGVAALFPGADILAKVIPTPGAFRLLVKLPTALACVLILLAAGNLTRRSAVRVVIAGIMCVTAYLVMASLYLHHDPLNQPNGDYAVAGLWPTEYAKKEMHNGISKDILWRRNPPPVERDSIYSRASQLTAASIFSLLYIATFVLLTLGLRSLSRKTS